MAKIKAMFAGENIKWFFLKHGEKLVLGVVGLFVAFALLGSSWFGYSKPPEELTQQLSQADTRIEQQSPWPEDEQLKYPPLNVQQDVDQMLVGISATPWRWETDFVGSVFGADEPRGEAELVAVMNLRADPGRTILAQSADPLTPDDEMSDEQTELASADSTTDEPDAADLVGDDFAERKTNVRGPGMGLGMDEEAGMGMLGPGAAGDYGGAGYVEEVRIDYDPAAYVMGPGEGMMGPDGMEMGGMGMGMGSSIKGVPVKYISVRGVFDLRKQVLNYSKALNVSEMEATRLVEFLDFKLERQEADARNGSFGEWEPVDIEVALDYLDQTLDFDPDVVSVGVRNPVITMPLPARLIGVWRNKANHPDVKAFELSDAEMEAEAALNRDILEKARESGKGIKQRTPPGGFAQRQLDVTSMQQDFFQETDARTVTRMFDDDEELKGTPAEVRKKLIERIKAQVSAAGNLVLFRYIDFDLEPGKSYRYRVQLVLRNPNYDQPVERVVHPSVVEGEIRETPLSEPSNVATVAPDYAYFLSRVELPRGIASEEAEMQIFQWYEQTGTLIKGKLSLEPGDFISGTTDTHVLDPAAMKYEVEEDVPFKTEDLLVDALVVSKFDPRSHPDLTLPKSLTRGELGVTPQVLVVNSDGDLQELDPISRAGIQKTYDGYYTSLHKPFENIKDAQKKRTETGPLDIFSAEAGMMDEEMMMMEGAGRMQDRRRNPTRRGRGGRGGRGGSSAEGAFGPGGPMGNGF